MKPAAFLVFSFLTLSWEIFPATAQTEFGPIQALTEKLQAIKKEIPLDWFAKMPEQKLIPPEIARRCLELQQNLLSELKTSKPEGYEYEAWSACYKSSFQLCVMLVWRTPDDSIANLRTALEALTLIRHDIGDEKTGRLCAALANNIFNIWMGSSHSTTLPLLQELERDWLPNQGQLPAWWLRQRLGYAEILILTSMSAGRHEKHSEPLASEGKRWMSEYFENPGTSDEQKTHDVCSWATTLYTYGLPDDAAAFLDDWARRHQVEYWMTARWLAGRFFVAQFGQADRVKAREILSKFDELIASGQLHATDALYQNVVRGYYGSLPKSDLECQQEAFAESIKSQKKYLGKVR